MLYKLILFQPGKEGQVVRTDISLANYIEMVKARDNLRRVMIVVDYYNMCVGNINDLINAIAQVWPSQIKGWSEINRKFLNFVSSFYAYLEFMEKNLTELFAGIKRKYYDNHFEYRLIYNLRKYATHRGLVITQVTYDALNEERFIEISPSHLIKNGKEYFQPIVLAELKSKADANEELDVSVLVEDFKDIFLKMNGDIMHELINSANRSVLLLYSYYTSSTLSDYTLYDESDSYMWSISEVLVNYRKKLENEYPNDK